MHFSDGSFSVPSQSLVRTICALHADALIFPTLHQQLARLGDSRKALPAHAKEAYGERLGHAVRGTVGGTMGSRDCAQGRVARVQIGQLGPAVVALPR